jgi:dTDP-4-amino-4,6-dideoxygalactose transaminase
MAGNEKIPFLDLCCLHASIEKDIVAVLRKALVMSEFVGGPMVEQFEHEFGQFCGVEHCVGVGSGTDAIRFALIAAGVKSGDVVVTTPHTFIATAEAISQAGARPDFVDIDERTHGLDPSKLQEYIKRECDLDLATGKLFNRKLKAPVTAVVPVHIYGQVVDMDLILDIATRYHLIVVEDACQAHGAEYYSRAQGRWMKAGSMGDAAAFSFYPGKNLGACGEAGAVTTNNEKIAQHIQMLRDHGQSSKYQHDIEGYNGRLDSIQAGILHVKINRLAVWNQQRCEVAKRYQELFEGGKSDITLPYEPSWSRPVYHLYVVRTLERNQLQEYLTKANIGTGIHYPKPLHRQDAYRFLGFKKGDFPVAERVTEQVISLPMYPGLTRAQQIQVVEALRQFKNSCSSFPKSEMAMS